MFAFPAIPAAAPCIRRSHLETVGSIMMGGRLNGNPLAQDFTICAPTADIFTGHMRSFTQTRV
jgi:hypothetical protein